MSVKYNHAFGFAFELVSGSSCENDNAYPTPKECREAIENSLSRLSDDELMENLGAPFDSFEVD